jgi:hypothetical protein
MPSSAGFRRTWPPPPVPGPRSDPPAEFPGPVHRLCRGHQDGIPRAKSRGSSPSCSVPEGFVITAAAYRCSSSATDLRDEINSRLQTLEVQIHADLFRLSSELQLLIIDAPLPEELQEAIHKAYRELEARVGHRGVRVAVRSSAVGDEGTAPSFHGNTAPNSMSAKNCCSPPTRRSWRASTPCCHELTV